MSSIVRRLTPIGIAILTGASLWLVQKGANLTGPLLFSGVRAVAVGAVLVVFARPKAPVWRSALRVALPLAASLAALAVGLTKSQITPISVALASTFALSMIGMRVIRQRAPQPLELVGLGLVAVSLVTLWAGGFSLEALVPTGLAAAGFASVILITDRTPSARRPIPFAGASLVLSGLFLWALGLAAGEHFLFSIQLSATLAGAVFFSGVGLYLARVRSLETVGIKVSRRVISFEPIGALSLAYLIGHQPSTFELSALAAAVAGIWMTGSSGRSAEIEVTTIGR